jgi:hypothetical protein
MLASNITTEKHTLLEVVHQCVCYDGDDGDDAMVHITAPQNPTEKQII